MSATNILDEVRRLGYKAKDFPDSTPGALRKAVSKGPVLAIVKLNVKTTGENHAVVVTGISEDGKQVRINDPWDGKAYTYSWSEFSKSWVVRVPPDATNQDFSAVRAYGTLEGQITVQGARETIANARVSVGGNRRTGADGRPFAGCQLHSTKSFVLCEQHHTWYNRVEE